MRTLRSRLKPFCVILTLGISACGVTKMFNADSKGTRLFSHKVHVQGESLECIACHAKAEKEDQAGMPASLKKCMLCHEGIDEGKSEDRKLATLLGEKPEWPRFTEAGEDIRFSHSLHVGGKGLACADCHPSMETNESVGPGLQVSMETCMECHAKQGASNDCDACHRTLKTDLPPPNHDLNWKQNHGPALRAHDDERYENRCWLCHTDQQCSSCHQDEAPRSHTNFWRLRQHGTAAGVDRTACATCHRDDFCDRCHRETEPSTHVGSWGEPGNRHCNGCHIPQTGGTNCSVCHDTIAHPSAPPRPSDAQHAGASASQCRTCHEVIGIPHIDNGDDCTSCH